MTAASLAPSATRQRAKVAAAFLLSLAALLGTSGCGTTPDPSAPYSPPTELDRNTTRAEELSRQGADALDAGDLERAEALFRESLTADLFYGPAHNNLGVVFLKQGKLYEAAQEFEWAKKLLPSAPDPRVNLAIVLERAGSEEDALASWQEAVEIAPRCEQALAGLARLSAIRGVPVEPSGL